MKFLLMMLIGLNAMATDFKTKMEGGSKHVLNVYAWGIDGNVMEATLWKLTNIAEDQELYQMSGSAYVVMVARDSSIPLAPGMMLARAVPSQCLKYLDQGTIKNAQGFTVQAFKYKRTKCVAN